MPAPQMPPPQIPASASGTDPSKRLLACHQCGLEYAVPRLLPGTVAACRRCGLVLGRYRADPLQRPLALSITGSLLLAVAVAMPFMTVSLGGRGLATHFTTVAITLEQFNMWELTLVVLGTTLIAPAVRLGCLVAVLAGLQLHAPPRFLYLLFRLADRLKQWAMIEVYMLGIFVAYSKLIDLAHVQVGPAVYALGALMIVMAATDASLDPEAVWDALENRGLVAEPARLAGHNPPPPGARRVACLSCGLVQNAEDGDGCPRCGAHVHQRKPNSLTRAWACLAAAAVMYIPANTFPVLTVISLGRGQPSTIIGGVVELARSHMWALAILVFVASITVPVLKILGLTVMLTSVHRRTAGRLRDRTRLYRVVELVGRWSMIDVFMISILTGLVRLGFIADVRPGIGAIAFASVVILTMLSAGCFDPRLMWDAARRNPGHELP